MVRKVWNDYFWWIMVALVIVFFIAYGILSDPYGPLSRANAADRSTNVKEFIRLLRIYARQPTGSFSVTVDSSIGDMKFAIYEPENGQPYVYIERNEIRFDVLEGKNGVAKPVLRDNKRLAYSINNDGTLRELRVVGRTKRTLKLTAAEQQERADTLIADMVEDLSEIVENRHKDRADFRPAQTRRLFLSPTSPLPMAARRR